MNQSRGSISSAIALAGPPDAGLAQGELQHKDSSYAWYVVCVLMFAYLVSFVDRLILALLIQPIKRDLGVSDLQVGLLVGIGFAFFYTTMGVPIARLADRVNRRWLIIIGITLWTAMTAASAFATSYLWLLVFRIGVGIGEATLTPAATSIIADYFSRDRLPKALGTYSMGLYFGAGTALLAGSAIVQATLGTTEVSLGWAGTFSIWQLAFLIAACPGVLAVALMFTVREPTRTEVAAVPNGHAALAAGGQSVPLRELLAFLSTHRKLLAAHFLGYGTLGTVVTAYLVWTPEMLHRTHGASLPEAGTLYGILLLTLGAIGPFIGGRLAQHLSRRSATDAEARVSIIASVLLIPFAIAFPLVPDLTLAGILLAPVVLLLAIPQGLGPTILQLITPNRMRGQVLSTFTLMAVIVAYAIGPTAVPVCAQLVFGSEQELGLALALIGGVLIPIGICALLSARRSLNALLATRTRE